MVKLFLETKRSSIPALQLRDRLLKVLIFLVGWVRFQVLSIVLILMMIPSFGFAKDDRFRCRANGAEGREADLRMEGTSFRASWEINLNGGQVPGQVVNIFIEGVLVGGIVLEESGNQLEGRLEYSEFPAGFPRIESGTPVNIGSLFCRFRRD